MPRRSDLSSILLIGSGPIVIGQGAEFDYSGTQAAKALRSELFRVVLVNSNPATIMTDPEFADATYIEPITALTVEAIIAKERPDALLPTLGGQTALNVTTELARRGVLTKYNVELIGAGLEAIEAAEDRGRFKKLMEASGLAVPEGIYAHSLQEAVVAARRIGFPVMIRPSYILGGGGTGIAFNDEEFAIKAREGLVASPAGEILVEESIEGWKEYELEVMRDRSDNAVIVCSIENLDPMGVHTGDSITVAPIQTLSDPEYQEMRDEAIACLRAVGVETGGANVQFAVDPSTGRRLLIEMNPRVSRSSALASKATGFPIAKIAALLAVGYSLDEITNDVTGSTPASFEPALDYVAVKVPRFDFAKFPNAAPTLGTSMRSVGEVMAIGRTFPEALQKGIRSLEVGRAGLNADPQEAGLRALDRTELLARCVVPTPDRLFVVAELLRRGEDPPSLATATRLDLWFIDQIAQIIDVRAELEAAPPSTELLRHGKRHGFSDAQLAYLWGLTEAKVRDYRRRWHIDVTFKTVDTCAAEFEAGTPYLYSAYEDEDEVPASQRPSVMILGSGPNRIGQGIEFDFCCVHAAYALREAGYETIMVNCNPETVSTDYDTADRLYFEPLTVEDVLAIVERERPEAVIVQLGGQTPLNLARALEDAGVPIAGTSPTSIDTAEDRERFSELCRRLELRQPPHGVATSVEDAMRILEVIGLPALVRPSYVLGGRAMRVVYSREELGDYLHSTYGPAGLLGADLTQAPLLIDRFLESATEVDVDAVYDGVELLVGGVMEHVEEAGVHSGDSACVVPPPTLPPNAHQEILAATERLAQALGVRGLINIQFAVKGEEVLILEANPRASRTVPFISKAAGVPIAKVAARVMMGATLEDLRHEGMLADPPGENLTGRFVAVKEAVLPWERFPEEDTVLGPEMKATGEVMGIGSDFGSAYGKALLGSGCRVPDGGVVFFSLADRDKPVGLAAAQAFSMLGFRLAATAGTARYLAHHGVASDIVAKVGEGPGDSVTRIESGQIALVVNTPRGRRARSDGSLIRAASRRRGIPCITTVPGALAVARSLQADDGAVHRVRSLQEWHR